MFRIVIISVFLILSLCSPLNITIAEDLHKTTVRGCFDPGGTDGVRYFWLRPETGEFFEIAWEELNKEQWDSLDECYCSGNQECTATITYTTDPEDYNVSDAKGLIRKFNSIKNKIK